MSDVLNFKEQALQAELAHAVYNYDADGSPSVASNRDISASMRGKFDVDKPKAIGGENVYDITAKDTGENFRRPLGSVVKQTGI